MLCQLSTVKNRLGILDTDLTSDALLTSAIQAVSARFDLECNRTLARTENFTQTFDAHDAELGLACYPVESVARFDLKFSESAGWVEQTGVDYLLRGTSVLSLQTPFARVNAPPALVRVTYTGGYVQPGAPDPPTFGPGAFAPFQRLPADLEQAAIEQTVYWFQNRDRQGLLRVWDYHATYRQFADADLLAGVRAVLQKYRRWNG